MSKSSLIEDTEILLCSLKDICFFYIYRYWYKVVIWSQRCYECLTTAISQTNNYRSKNTEVSTNQRQNGS